MNALVIFLAGMIVGVVGFICLFIAMLGWSLRDVVKEGKGNSVRE